MNYYQDTNVYQPVVIDTQLLQQLAKNATPGPRTWGSKYVCRAGTYELLAQVPDGKYDSAEWCANAHFIAACSPEVVLELIRQLEAKDVTIRELIRRNEVLDRAVEKHEDFAIAVNKKLEVIEKNLRRAISIGDKIE